MRLSGASGAPWACAAVKSVAILAQASIVSATARIVRGRRGVHILMWRPLAFAEAPAGVLSRARDRERRRSWLVRASKSTTSCDLSSRDADIAQVKLRCQPVRGDGARSVAHAS